MIGKMLTHYEILDLLGRGGMGEVYRARDTKLRREVAIKVLPEVLANHPDLLGRFEREAHLLAAINHPNIAAIHELGHADNTHFLVMELVEGPGFDEILAQRSMSTDELLPLFAQVAEALEFAHERSIVHRDLKPANIKLTAEGKAKILDFGLGKAFEGGAISTVSQDGTLAVGESPATLETGEGRILGTPAYMSPEQARGMIVDKRTDIWAFGACMYEALAGRRPFVGNTATDLLAEIVKSEPNWDALPADTPARIRVLMWRCLQKDPRRRLRDIGEARLELSGDASDPSGILPSLGLTAEPAAPDRKNNIVLSAAALLAGIVITSLVMIYGIRPGASTTETERPVKRFEMDIGATTPLFMQDVAAELAIAPLGDRLVYAADVDGRRRLYLRRLDDFEAEPLQGTENAWRPFFSPDGNWVAFFVPGDPAKREGSLFKISVDGGMPQKLCDAFPPVGGTWMDDGHIVFTHQAANLDLSDSPFRSQLFRVSENGGSSELLTEIDEVGNDEWNHTLPNAVTGHDFLLFNFEDSQTRRNVAMLDLRTKEHHVLVRDAINAQFVGPDHLVFARAEGLWAARFDPKSRAVGEPFLVAQDAQVHMPSVTAPFGVSADGSLVYVPVAPVVDTQRTLVWVDHDGREETIAVPPGKYWWPRVAPDGTRVAMSFRPAPNGNEDIWIHQFERAQSMTRFTFDPALDANPLWSPDGRHLYFSSARSGGGDVYRRRADGTGSEEIVLADPEFEYPGDISPDGNTLLFGHPVEGHGYDIAAVDLSAPQGQGIRELLATRFGEGGTQLSPDGRWLAYNTDETAPTQVFVRPFPDLEGGRWQISTDGGINPSWSRDAKEIYYRHGRQMMAVEVQTEPSFRVGRPRVLFEADYYYAPDLSKQYDLEYPGRRRFLMVKELAETRTTRLVHVENWVAELRRRSEEAGAGAE